MKVTAILVSHNGARWLPAVLAGVEASTLLPAEIVAVDTGSTDASVSLLERALGSGVVSLGPGTAYADAVRAGLGAAGPAEPGEWIWLLHDDSNPAPDCLAVLAAAAEAAPAEVAALGPKLREWPSLKRLLEVGVTLTGTGRRETGLESGEYDQGQHDQQHRVLAVNTAGMLVRREVLESVGLDPNLPVFGTDLDFGWRIARAGMSVRVEPGAVVFHLGASRLGVRDAALVEHPLREEREAAQYTLLVNSAWWTVPFRSVRMAVGGLMRALGLLLVRAPREAADEIAALFGVFLHPWRVIRARRERAGTASVPHREVRPLLAPFWLPYRHGLDYVTDVGMAVAASTRAQAARRRPGSADTGLVPALLRSPSAWGLLVALVLAAVAGRSLLGSGALHGGALLPVPDEVSHWWSLWGSGRHTVGTGSSAPGPAYLLPMALAGTVALGSTGFVVTALVLLCVPLSYLGALRFLRRITRGRWAPVWGGLAYSMLPVVTGALVQGRLGTIAGAVVLPWVAGSALLLASVTSDGGDRVRRWRAAWRTAIGAALLVAFVPPAWPVLLVVVVVLVLVTRSGAGFAVREAVVVLVVPLLTALPWVIGVLRTPQAWLVEGGRAAAIPSSPGVADLVLGRAGGVAAPGWVSAGIVLAAVVAFVRADTRPLVARAWTIAAVAATMLAVTSQIAVSLPGIPQEFRPWPGFLLVVIHGALIVAATVAADGVVRVASDAGFGWRQPLGALACAGALLMPVAGAVWWLGADGPVERSAADVLPDYMVELAAGTDTSGVLHLSGGLARGIDYQVLRSGPVRLGDDGVLALTAPDEAFRDLVGRLLSSAGPDDSALLASYGIKYVYAPAPVASSVSGGLDATPGLGGASAPSHGSRAWVVQHDTSLGALPSDRARLRPLWVTAALLSAVTMIVMAAPERRRR